MTTEERVFIEPRDIAFIESECPKCHTRTIVPFTDQNLLPERCGNVSCPSEFFKRDSEDRKRLQYALDEFFRYASSKNPVVTLRFQIKPASTK